MDHSRRASLGRLPVEVKEMIAKLVACQDAVYRARTVISGQDPYDALGRKKDAGLADYGNSLSTLRLLNKEFSALGGSLMFSTVHARRSLDPVFRYRIVHHYANSVERIDFAKDTSAEQCAQIVACFRHFPNLRQLYFNSKDTVDHIMGSSWDTDLHQDPSKLFDDWDAELTHATLELKSTALRMKHLHLDDGWDSLSAAVFLANLFPNLTSLTLDVEVMDDFADVTEGKLAETVKSLQALTSLEITSAKEEIHFSESWYTGRSPTGLKRLVINTTYLTLSLWKMVEWLGQGVEVMELNFPLGADPEFEDGEEFDEDFTPLGPGRIVFPNLKKLDIGDVFLSDEATTSFLSRFASSPVTDLNILIENPDYLFIYFQTFSLLEKITINHISGNLSVADSIHRSSAKCAARELAHTSKSAYRCTSKDPVDLISGPMATRVAAHGALNFAAVQLSLDFGQYRLDRAKLDELVALQDAAYKARTVVTDEDGEVAIEKKKDAGIGGYGETLSTLRLLNKEFCELCSAPMFSTIHAIRSLSPVFRYRVTHRYASSVKRIEFALDTSAEQCAQTVAAFGHFPNLRQLYINSSETADHLMGTAWALYSLNDPTILCCNRDPAFTFAAEELETTALRIHHLHLDNGWNSRKASVFLDAFFPNLTSLKLHDEVMDDSAPRAEGCLAAAVKSLRALTFLEIQCGGGGIWLSESWYTGWPESRINRVKISATYLNINMWKMVECFGPNIEVLELDVTDLDEEFQEEFESHFLPISVGHVLFPKLKRLDMRDISLSDAGAPSFLTRLVSAPVTDLEILVRSSQDLSTVFRTFPLLDKININQSSASVSIAVGVHHSSAECAAKGLAYTVTTYRKYYSTRPCDLLVGPTPSPAAASQALQFAAVQRTLEFGLFRLERARLDGDGTWNSKSAMVEQLERQRLAWED
ncbi:hypothetical protein P7C70_g1575, partial [Phenoliferia sp. Uapishka_3]